MSTPIQSADPRMVRIEALNEASSVASLEAGRALLLEYGRHILSVEGPARFCFGKLEDEARELPQSYISMHGECLVAWVDANAAGCVTYRALSAMSGTCEMKRLWVRPEFRGLKVGERLTLALLERARVSGFTAVCLDTVPETMGAAYRMYLRLGFAECPAFHKSATEGMLFMRCSLERESR